MALPFKSLEERFWPKVEKTETCWNWTASKMTSGYGQIGSGGKGGRPLCAHRVAYELEVGPIPDGMQIDHICHNRLCVNPAHLRAVTNKQNNEHRAGLKRNNKSGYTGVRRSSTPGRWTAEVFHHGVRHYLGRFERAEDAGAAAAAKRLELFTHNDLDRLAA